VHYLVVSLGRENLIPGVPEQGPLLLRLADPVVDRDIIRETNRMKHRSVTSPRIASGLMDRSALARAERSCSRCLETDGRETPVAGTRHRTFFIAC
jgi:hypothetical protein